MDWTDLIHLIDLHDAGCLKWLIPVALIIGGVAWYYATKLVPTLALSGVGLIWLIVVFWSNNQETRG